MRPGGEQGEQGEHTSTHPPSPKKRRVECQLIIDSSRLWPGLLGYRPSNHYPGINPRPATLQSRFGSGGGGGGCGCSPPPPAYFVCLSICQRQRQRERQMRGRVGCQSVGRLDRTEHAMPHTARHGSQRQDISRQHTDTFRPSRLEPRRATEAAVSQQRQASLSLVLVLPAPSSLYFYPGCTRRSSTLVQGSKPVSPLSSLFRVPVLEGCAAFSGPDYEFSCVVFYSLWALSNSIYRSSSVRLCIQFVPF